MAAKICNRWRLSPAGAGLEIFHPALAVEVYVVGRFDLFVEFMSFSSKDRQVKKRKIVMRPAERRGYDVKKL
uniref:Uncharacterized protein n=1 Tax=Romanomermis culicivorax TaxID=13658 RepID=A0A915KP37_ROMCU